MAHFAKLDENNIVIEVVTVKNEVATDEATGITFLKNLYKEPNDVWKQTSYNTKMGKYWDNNQSPPVEHADQSKAFRLNYAGIDWVWSEELQGFIEGLQPHASWTLDSSTGNWNPPIARVGAPYIIWDEENQTWEDQEGNLAP